MGSKIDGVFRTRSLGTAASGLTDQYADGKAAKVWQQYIGDTSHRTTHYKKFLVELLKSKGCKKVLDVACGTGVDSVMLLEEGFEVVSSDASDKMLKHAYKTRWDRRKEEAFDKWIIEECNWLNANEHLEQYAGDGFDAIMCMGNSFPHLTDTIGDQSQQRDAIANFHKLIKPGGILVIDHRNYDAILDSGKAPTNNIYYNSKHMVDIRTSILFVNNHADLITLDYTMDMSDIFDSPEDKSSKFRLSYYPHRLEDFSRLLKSVFGKDSKHSVYSDFKMTTEVNNPGFYIHVSEKKKE